MAAKNISISSLQGTTSINGLPGPGEGTYLLNDKNAKKKRCKLIVILLKESNLDDGKKLALTKGRSGRSWFNKFVFFFNSQFDASL